MSLRYTVFLHLTLLDYLFIYLFVYLYISGVLLYCYCLSLVSVDQLAKSCILLNLFSRDPTLGA